MKDKKLKIGLFLDTYFPMVDGVVMVMHNYACILSKMCDVTVFVPKGRKPFDDSTLPYKVVRCNKLRLPGDYDLPLPNLGYSFLKKLKKAELDLIHIHSPFTMGKIAVSYAKKHKIPIIATMHSQYKQDFYKATKSKILTNFLLKRIMKVFNACDECWAVNSDAVEVFKGYGATKPIEVMLNGTEITYFDNKAELEKMREQYGIKSDEKVFLFVGRINAIKNIFFIVDALKLLKNTGFKFKMFFIGKGPDENKLKQEIEKNKLEKEVFMLGYLPFREDLTKFYRLTDLFLFPSLYDTNSLVPIEAASQKTPTLYIKGALTASTITEDVNGFLSENSTLAFCDKIIEIFSDSEYYAKVQEGAYNDIYITWDKAVMQAYNNYLRILGNKNLENLAGKTVTKPDIVS